MTIQTIMLPVIR